MNSARLREEDGAAAGEVRLLLELRLELLLFGGPSALLLGGKRGKK